MYRPIWMDYPVFRWLKTRNALYLGAAYYPRILDKILIYNIDLTRMQQDIFAEFLKNFWGPFVLRTDHVN